MNPLVFDGNFKYSPFIPYDFSINPLLAGYVAHPCFGGVQPFVYSDWRDEMLSWHDSCFLHAGLNPAHTVTVKGKGAMDFFNKYFVNGFSNFPVGKIKHGIMVNEDGLIMFDGLLIRTGEEEFYTYWLGPYLEYVAEKSGYDIELENITGEVFMHQIAGPRSLEIIESATGEDFHDLPFLEHRESTLQGMKVRILRIGMAGSLAYEIHGQFDDSIPVYNAILEAGEPYGIKRLGRHAYWNTHTEGGFPQWNIHFPYAWEKDPQFMQWMVDNNCGIAYYAIANKPVMGSMGPDPEPRYSNPFELGWGKAVNFNHEFVGKEALLKISENHREMVSLVWNVEDILDIYRSEFEQGEPYAALEGPEDYLQNGQFAYRADKVLVGDTLVGMSTGRIMSWYYRQMVSLAVMDPEYSAIGTEVVVLWGDVGTRQKRIRATVEQFPYSKVERNDSIDIGKIPSGIK
jgi:glycine cleavage system aminomethyltransferase T